MRIESVRGVHWRGGAEYDRSMGITLKTFGGRVRWLMDQPEHGNGMSQKELAAAIGLSEQFTGALILGRRNPNVRHLQAFGKALKTSVSFLALTTDDPSPDAPESAPVYFSPQADEAAQLIDAMRDDDLRDIALDLVRVLAMYDIGEGDDPSRTGTGGVSRRLIAAKLLGGLKKSAALDRATLRSNSE